MPPPSPAPPLWRDPWAWATLAALIPLVLHCLGAPLGEPAAEDFDFLHRALLEHRHTLLDGGGSLAFWRPLSHQVYYILFGPLMLAHPRAIAAIHVLALGAGSLLLYRMLRSTWPGYAAAAAAAFPLLADSTRAIITWPTHSVDLGSYFFSALALHEAARRRMPASLAALLAALLCKEVNVVAALLLPWVPRAGPTDRRTRLRWAAASFALVAVWAAAYLAIRRHAGLELPHGLERNPALLATPIHARLAWAAWNSVRAIFSLALAPGRWDSAVGAAVVALIALALAVVGPGARARRRLRAGAPWTLWGLGWFAAACGTLATIYPLWAPARTMYGSIGLGIALVGLLNAAHPALLALVLVVKLAAFAVSPAAPHAITGMPDERGAFTDFPRIARLQILMSETRATLRARFPRLPPGAMVGQMNMPLASQYAFGGSKALEVWYRDSTLRWVSFDEFSRRPNLDLVAVVQYQPGAPRQVVLVNVEATRGMLRAYERLEHNDFAAAIREVDHADSLQSNREAKMFIGSLAGVRAWCVFALGDPGGAEREALRAVELWPAGPEANLVLGARAADRGDLAGAEAAFESVVAQYPDHPAARQMLARLRAARAQHP